MTGRERKRLADEVRAAIKASELSMYELSRRSGVDSGSLSRFMSGKGTLGFRAVERLAPVLHLHITTDPPKKTKK